MNTVVILTLIFGGILFFILDVMLFDINKSNIIWIIMSIIAFIPVIGLITYVIIFVYYISTYEIYFTKYIDKDYNRNTYVKDTKLNRWLFNDVEWSHIDSYIDEDEEYD